MLTHLPESRYMSNWIRTSENYEEFVGINRTFLSKFGTGQVGEHN